VRRFGLCGRQGVLTAALAVLGCVGLAAGCPPRHRSPHRRPTPLTDGIEVSIGAQHRAFAYLQTAVGVAATVDL